MAYFDCLAGLINATNAAAYALAPVASTSLYGLSQGAPIILAVGLIAATGYPVLDGWTARA